MTRPSPSPAMPLTRKERRAARTRAQKLSSLSREIHLYYGDEATKILAELKSGRKMKNKRKKLAKLKVLLGEFMEETSV